MNLHGKTVKDYIICEDCEEVVDLWKYGDTLEQQLEDSGHTGHDWRYITEAELVDCIKDCEEPRSRCPVCHAYLEDYTEDYCYSCGKHWPQDKINYENCFGSCDSKGNNFEENK